MTTSVQSAVGGFIGSVSHIGTGLVRAFIILFSAFLAFGQALLNIALEAGQAVFKLGTDLFQSVAGFIFANFFILAILAGGYFFWSSKSQTSARGGKKPRK